MKKFNKLDPQYTPVKDEDLAEITGGFRVTYHYFKSAQEVVFKFEVGQHIEAVTSVGLISNHVYTKGCTVVERNALRDEDGHWLPYYLVRSDTYTFNGKWLPEHCFEHGYKEIFVY